LPSPPRLDAVFNAAVKESRQRTLRRIPLPPEESFLIEYVTGKSWSGYNWYQGNCHSLIQINTEFPIYIDRAIDLASHEGIPVTMSTMPCLRPSSSGSVAGWNSPCMHSSALSH